jgi:glyoxylase-like metal-dependent hydrolase (beta-lactamase superfamily II)
MIMGIETSWKLFEVGKTRRDAGALFGEEPRSQWLDNYIAMGKENPPEAEKLSLSRSNHVLLSSNVLLIQTEADTILVDTGTPSITDGFISEEWTNSKLRATLRQHKILSSDITKVILTSLDIDHAGGMVHYDRAGKAVLAFDKATTYYHQNDCNRARPRTIARADVAIELMDKGRTETVTQTTEISPGVFLHPVLGPSGNGAVVEISRGADRIYYLADLCPTVFHLHNGVIPSFDDSPESTYLERHQWLQAALAEGYLVIFGHGVHVKAGYIEDSKEGLRFKPVLVP